MNERDRMSVIRHWLVSACQNCGLPFSVYEDCPKDRDGIHIEGGTVKVVPLSQLEGAVEALERIVFLYADAPEIPAADLADVAGEWLDSRGGQQMTAHDLHTTPRKARG